MKKRTPCHIAFLKVRAEAIQEVIDEIKLSDRILAELVRYLHSKEVEDAFEEFYDSGKSQESIRSAFEQLVLNKIIPLTQNRPRKWPRLTFLNSISTLRRR